METVLVYHNSLYAQYIQERENMKIIESDEGFATYKILDTGECYLRDIYVVPESRKSGLAAKMTHQIIEIAKKNDCHTLVGSVATDATDPTTSLKVFLNYGMKIRRVVGSMIYLYKDISGDK